ncbi:RING-H2 finger protein ATL47 [Spatholobus suberectus]|nr:RING-H2 finger protein ATL47 [Spatholobus suberectus]
MEVVISLIILFVGIAILVVIHICIVGRAFRGQDEGTQGQSSNSMKRMFGGDNIGDLKNLPCFVYEEPEGGGSLVDCAVCLENFKVGDVCRLLPNCSHSFHVQCIDSWILQTPICPICRTWVHSRVMVPSALREERCCF